MLQKILNHGGEINFETNDPELKNNLTTKLLKTINPKIEKVLY